MGPHSQAPNSSIKREPRRVDYVTIYVTKILSALDQKGLDQKTFVTPQHINKIQITQNKRFKHIFCFAYSRTLSDLISCCVHIWAFYHIVY